MRRRLWVDAFFYQLRASGKKHNSIPDNSLVEKDEVLYVIWHTRCESQIRAVSDHCKNLYLGGDEMKQLVKYFAIMALLGAVLVLPAAAQWRNDPRDDDYYGRNDDGYGRRGYANIRYNVQNLKENARNFERLTNRLKDRRDDRNRGGWGNWGSWGNWGGRNTDYRRIENLADDFRKATEKLADKYGNGRNLDKSRDAAYRVIEIGRELDSEISRSSRRGELRSAWEQIRYDLDTIARVYGFNGYRRTNRFPF
jgi:hypothetical protein